MQSKCSRGFTLLEILIVLVILGIIVSLAAPSFSGQVERSRAAEALRRFEYTRDALSRFHSQNGTFVGATIPLGGGPGTIDYNPNSAPFGENLLFTYTLQGVGANTYTIRATRNAFAGCSTIGRIDINQNGNRIGTGPYANI